MNGELNLKKSLKSNFYKIFNCVVTETAQFLSSYSFYIAASLLAIYSFIGKSYLISSRDIFNVLYSSQYVQIVEIGIFIILGVQISGKEKQCNSDEFIAAIYHGKLIKSISKVAAAALLCLSWYAARCVITIVLSVVMKMSWKIIAHCVAYLALTTLFPILIGSVLGLCIGQQINGSSKYAVALTSWVIISPILSLIREYMVDLLNNKAEWLQYVFNLISLGTPISHDSALTYGFEMESPRWIHVCVYLLITLLYYILLNIETCRYITISKVKNVSISCAYIFCLLFAVFVSYNKESSIFFNYYTYEMTKAPNFDWKYSFAKYYTSSADGNTLNKEEVPNFPTEVCFTPISWDVYLDTSPMNINVSAKLTADLQKDCIEQSFTLYRQLKLLSVKINGKKVDYTQDGDYFTVIVPDYIDREKSVTFDFKYSGISSPVSPGNNYMVCLPADFAWIPSLGINSLPEKVTDMNTLYSMPLNPQLNGTEEVSYKLKFKNSNVVYTNLDKVSVSDNVYTGKSKMGLSVVAYPLQKVKKINGQTVYYPLYLEDVLNDMVYDINQSNQLRNRILADLEQPLHSDEYKSTIIIFPKYVCDMIEFPMIDDNINYFVYNAYSKDIYYRKEDYQSSKNGNIVSNAVNSLFYGTTFINYANEYDYVNKIVTESFGKWYFDNISEEYKGYGNSDFDFYMEHIDDEISFSKDYKKQIKTVGAKLNDMIENHEDEALQKFFSEWYAKQKSRKYSDVYEVMDMLGMEATK